jgi:hypothetical protein
MPRNYISQVEFTYEEVSSSTGVSVSQLKRWGQEGDWVERKREYRQALADIKRKTVLLKRDLLDKAMHSLDPQSVYAFSSISQATKNDVKTAAKPEIPIQARSFETREEAVDALAEAVQQKINKMISVPGELDFKALQDLKKAWDMLEDMKAKYNPEEKRDKILSSDEIKNIREQLKL